MGQFLEITHHGETPKDGASCSHGARSSVFFPAQLPLCLTQYPEGEEAVTWQKEAGIQKRKKRLACYFCDYKLWKQPPDLPGSRVEPKHPSHVQACLASATVLVSEAIKLAPHIFVKQLIRSSSFLRRAVNFTQDVSRIAVYFAL